MKIRKARINESQAIRKFEDRAWKEKNITSKYDIANFVRFGHVFVAEDRGKIVGLICAMETKDGEIYVEEWVVGEKCRGKGIGKHLYNELIKVARKKKILAFTQLGNKVSIKAHQKLGFKIIKKVEDAYNLGQPRLLMIREKK